MAVPSKILLKSTTKMSLNERFSKLPAPASTETVRTMAAAESQASAKNRRLALQMENRPSVKAALGQSATPAMMPTINQPTAVSMLPIQQPRLMPMQSSHTMQSSLPMQRLHPQQRISPKPVPVQQRVGKPNIKARLAMPQRAAPIQRGGPRGRVIRGQQRGIRARMTQQRPRGGMPFINSRGGRGISNRGFTNRGNNRGNRGRGGRGRGRGGNRPALSSQALDTQLDEYMSKTKAHLDAELDAYMAESAN